MASPTRTATRLPSRRCLLPAGRQFDLGLVVLALMAFSLRIYRLDVQSLWRDEVDAVIFASRQISAILDTFTSVGENGPLFFLGLHAWIGLVGTSEFAIRFPSAVFGTLAVLVTYRLGAEVVGREAGLIGAILLAVSPYHIWYSQEAKMYALISLMAPLGLLIMVQALRGDRRRLWPVWAVLMTGFLYIHLFATLMALVALAWLPVLLPRRPRLTAGLVAALAAMALAAMPIVRWLLPAALTPAETGYYPYSLSQMVGILLVNFSMGLRPSAGLWPVALFALLLVAGCLPLVVRRCSLGWPPAHGVLLLLLYLAGPLLAVWLVSLRRPTFTDRYLIISLPAFYLMMAVGIVALRHLLQDAWSARLPAASMVSKQPPAKKRADTRPGQWWTAAATRPSTGMFSGAVALRHAARRGRLLGIALVLLVVVAGLPFIWQQTHTPIKADFRAATVYIVEHAGPDDVLMFVMPYVQRGFAYYHPQPVRTIEPPYTRDMSAADVDKAMRELMAGTHRVWLFLSEADFWDPQGMIVAWFERHAVRRCEQGFAYIEVRCYDMTP